MEIISESKEGQELFYVILPFGKSGNTRGYYDIIIYSDQDIQTNQLRDWKYSVAVDGEWKIGSCGGQYTEENPWLTNPQYKLKFLSDVDTPKEVGILLSQSKSVLDMFPYSLIPYEFFIGFYILDKEVFDIVVQTEEWKNSQEVYRYFVLKTGSEFVILPTTSRPDQLTTYRLKVFSDVPIEIDDGQKVETAVETKGPVELVSEKEPPVDLDSVPPEAGKSPAGEHVEKLVIFQVEKKLPIGPEPLHMGAEPHA
jgi:hypothetical protein